MLKSAVKQMVFYTNYATFNRWDDERNVNVNRNDNDWNDNWWFAGVRNSLYFPLSRVFFYFTAFIHPPSILPISFNFSESFIYFLLSSDFISQESCKKYFGS